jgi:hypothetical protein
MKLRPKDKIDYMYLAWPYGKRIEALLKKDIPDKDRRDLTLILEAIKDPELIYCTGLDTLERYIERMEYGSYR